ASPRGDRSHTGHRSAHGTPDTAPPAGPDRSPIPPASAFARDAPPAPSGSHRLDTSSASAPAPRPRSAPTLRPSPLPAPSRAAPRLAGARAPFARRIAGVALPVPVPVLPTWAKP